MRYNILNKGKENFRIGKEEGHMVNPNGSPVQVKFLNFTMQGRNLGFALGGLE